MSPRAHRRRVRSATLDGLSSVSVLGGTIDRGVPPPSGVTDFFIGLNAADIQARPITGTGSWGQSLSTAWNNVLSRAATTIETTARDPNDKSPNAAFANAIAWVKTGTQSFKDKVTTALAAVAGNSAQATPTTGWLTGSHDRLWWGHHVAGMVIAADLIGYRTPDMLAFADKARTLVMDDVQGGCDTMEKYAKCNPNSGGSHNRASYMCCTLFLGEALPAWVFSVIKAFYGDNTEWHTYADSGSFHADGLNSNGELLSTMGGTWGAVNANDAWWPINSNADPKKNNAVMHVVFREDSSVNINYREWPSGQPRWGNAYIDSTSNSGLAAYFFTAMQGDLLVALLAEKHGMPNVWTTDTNYGPRRAWDYIWAYRDNWPSPSQPCFYAEHAWTDCLMELKYPGYLDRSYGNPQTAPRACGSGYSFGFTDWLLV